MAKKVVFFQMLDTTPDDMRKFSDVLEEWVKREKLDYTFCLIGKEFNSISIYDLQKLLKDVRNDN